MRRFVDGAWSPGEQVVSDARRTLHSVALAADSTGRAVVAWARQGQVRNEGHGLRVRLMAADGSWSAPAVLVDPTTRTGDPFLAAMQGGGCVVGWPQLVSGDDVFKMRVRAHPVTD
ncbi:MAG: hypothetical protein R2731_06600 [Nocardioides sp.]